MKQNDKPFRDEPGIPLDDWLDVGSCLGIGPGGGAGFLDFVHLNGQAIRAKLVSHKQGKVTRERGDGKRFATDSVQFQVDDQIHILEWRKETPETCLDRFRIVDPRGVAVSDWVTPLATMKNRTWDNTGDMVRPTFQPRD